MSGTRYLHFGPYRLDRVEGRLWRDATAIPLNRKSLRLLRFLAEHAGQLVTKQDLLTAVWPRSVVVEAVLTTAVREVRRALDDRTRQPAFVETVHGQGYRFIAPVIARDSSPAPAGTSQRLVGREKEWDQLRERFAAAFAGVRQVVFLAGESGIGKTALVDGFVTQLATESNVNVLRGQCIEHYGTGEAYLPILEALGRLGAGAEGAELTRLLGRYAPSWLPHLSSIGPEAELVNVAAGQTTPLCMLRELTEALDQLAARRPVVFVLEDLHWSDTATLDWLAYVARRRDPARLLVLATYRPVEVIVRTHPLHTVVSELHAQSLGTRCMLDYLSPDAVVRHVQLRFDGLREAGKLAHLLYERTRGHPLFLVTILETLVRDGLLEHDANVWKLRGPLAAVADLIPISVSQFIERRIETLAAEDQRVLEAASAAGDTFAVAAIVAATACTEEHIEARCECWARERQFLVPAGSEQWPDGTVTARYRFRHALFHDVVYRRISAGRRARLHRAIGHALAGSYGSTAASIAAELAVHFEQGGDAVAAVSYLEQAANRAITRSAYAETLKHTEKALALLGRFAADAARDQQELRLQLKLGKALMATRGWAIPAVEDAHRRAKDLAEQLGDINQLIAALWGLMTVSVVRADPQSTRILSTQLLELTGEQNAVPFQMVGHRGLGAAAFCLGELAHANREYALADKLYEPAQHPLHVARTGCDHGVFLHSWWSHLLWVRGEASRAIAMSEGAVKLARSFAHPFTLTIALAYAAILRQFVRDAATAKALAEEAIDLCAEHGFLYYETWGKIVLGWCRAGESDSGGIAQIGDGIGALQAAGVRRLLPYFHALLAEVQLQLGELPGAQHAINAGFDIVRITGECWWAPELWRLKAELSVARSEDPVCSAQLLRTAFDLAQRFQSKSLMLRSATRLCQLTDTSTRAEARATLTALCDGFIEGGDTPDLIAARAALQHPV